LQVNDKFRCLLNADVFDERRCPGYSCGAWDTVVGLHFQHYILEG
jgi:hypothetical protein